MAEKKETRGFASHPENINRNGRPPKGQSLTELMEEHLYNVPEGEKVSNKEKFIETVWEMAIKERDLQAIKLIWNYIDGKPIQKLEAKISKGLEELSDDELERALQDT